MRAPARAKARPGLVTYTTAGDPDLPRSAEILKALDRAGADVLEVGVPFSDPLADGPVIQRATERALAAGGSLRASLDLIAAVRARCAGADRHLQLRKPDVRMGLDAFAGAGGRSGVDGVLALDLPIEEADEFRNALSRAGIDTIFLLSPTTTTRGSGRRRSWGAGFSTASRAWALPARATPWRAGAEAMVQTHPRASPTVPLALGFGISRPEHVAEVGAYADAAVVGSALVALIAEASGSPQLIARVEGYVRSLSAACVASTGSHMTLDDLRKDIDRVDEVLVRLLNERARCVCEIGRVKKETGSRSTSPIARSRCCSTCAQIASEGPLGPDAIARLFERIIDEARAAGAARGPRRDRRERPGAAGHSRNREQHVMVVVMEEAGHRQRRSSRS